MKKLAAIFCLYASLVGSGLAQNDQVPSIVTDGLDAYKKSGFQAAFEIWLKDSPLENDTTTKVAIKGGIAQMEAAYGKMMGSEIIKSVTISPSVRRIYVTILYEKGPVFSWFECYKTAQEWIIPTFDANTKSALILPPSFLDNK